LFVGLHLLQLHQSFNGVQLGTAF